MNEGQYCLVEQDAVTQGPQRLPATWGNYSNLRNNPPWTDAKLVGIGWYPTTIITPDYDPATQYLGAYQFTIHAASVDAEREVIDKTQQQIDQEASTTVTDSQRVGMDLALQTETIMRQNDDRKLVGSDPLIPAADEEGIAEYLKSCYDAADDPAVAPLEPPGATRQLTAVPGENRDRAVIRREHVEFGGWNYYEIQYTLYTGKDATGMSLWVEKQDGTYLFTLPLVDQGDGVWFVTTDKTSGTENFDEFRVALFKGVKISQDFDLPPWDEEGAYPMYMDVRWLDESLDTMIADGRT